MSDPGLLKKLPDILKQHVQWLEDPSIGQRANLREANLQRADLQGANLREANLQRADLQRAHLLEANLQRADLRRTVLAARTPNEFLGGQSRTEDGLLIGYKGVKRDGTNYAGNCVYEVGKVYEETLGSGDIVTECHPGLHLCTTPEAARAFEPVVLECSFDIGDVLSVPARGVSDDKFRVRRFKVEGIYVTQRKGGCYVDSVSGTMEVNLE